MSVIPPKDAVLPPLEMSDRVDHPKFGFGTVSAPPEGDRYHVLFDDPKYGTKNIVRRFLFLVTRPDARGSLYWNQAYAQLLSKSQDHRWRTDEVMKRAFRDPQDEPINAATLRECLEIERDGLTTLLEFLDADEAGKHQ